MKAIVILFVLVAVIAAKTTHSNDVGILEDNPVFDYHTKVGIPLANEIRKAEAQQQSARIVGGIPAVLGQFPYQVGILIDLVSGAESICGGVLISNTRVLTAAHCWWNRRDQALSFTVVAGSITIFTGGDIRRTTNVIMHGGWDPDRNLHNIAVVILGSVYVYNPFIRAIDLPTGSELDESFIGLIVTASGFGLTGDGDVIPDDQVLRYADMYLVNTTNCNYNFPTYAGDNHVCATDAGNGAGTCLGDDGGPLTITRNNRRILIGIKSIGNNIGCQLGHPVAFTKISPYVDWIRRLL